MYEESRDDAICSGHNARHHNTDHLSEVRSDETNVQNTTITVSTQTKDNSLRVSANTLTTFAIAIIQDTHNAVYDQMRTYYQMAHYQATVETPYRVQQSMNNHYNIALLAECEQLIDATPDTKSKSSFNAARTNADNTQLKMPVKALISHSLPSAENTDTSNKPSVTGCVSPVQ